MLKKLQRKTLSVAQLVWYSLTLLVGATLTLLIFQLSIDIGPIFKQEAGVLSKQAVVISKKISLFQTLDKDRIYFSPEEVQSISQESFVKSVARFRSASFKVRGYTDASANIPAFYTELFFESVPDSCLDIHVEEWKSSKRTDFIPVIIPESYIKLYNFGFAESQGLPVLSKGMISQFPFHITVSGNGIQHTYDSRIVGFSNKINSILVPDHFLKKANEIYGKTVATRVSRLLVTFHDPSDSAILAYFNDKSYSINQEGLRAGKWKLMITIALGIMMSIGVIITAMSLFLILLSVHLIIQKNRTLILNLFSIGYRQEHIARFYRWTISLITTITLLLSWGISVYVRGVYVDRFATYFRIENSVSHLWVLVLILWGIVLLIYNLLLTRQIKGVLKSL
ncbi:hypothetical protein K5X82_08525 [Halosquirtibacter xylanolyticus]|uniref:hypothetical protein n=1 Tax=Halosquirtibacter xylanolyticus TaxID=3374599 RepID=UPI003747883B|nr:hypothetical protein K5X82_08525 [Prolixibacteraceae bacterium]